jgi:hypothetical protein
MKGESYLLQIQIIITITATSQSIKTPTFLKNSSKYFSEKIKEITHFFEFLSMKAYGFLNGEGESERVSCGDKEPDTLVG